MEFATIADDVCDDLYEADERRRAAERSESLSMPNSDGNLYCRWMDDNEGEER